ncbi:thiamine pyrophosphate-dependent dehydrogenase E1 component subunit alpha [Tepidanaerobacter syntrophicus]|uniref:thiamine pyrophosphate-dependent dehydrogenase E1 component subunit alpha n=1 Tax=Tepidanaerobacter syntrophicus TaxID=224999 RepID=UPI001BD5B481|nr:thiamine pyrophosphate-dependent dehydrogenase E1 component subunit alpha [Tepidanaerobacter syntrophicus]
MDLSKSDLLEMYRQMVLTRLFDIKTDEWFKKGLLKEVVHQSTGQEAIPIGSCYAIGPDDKVLPSLRTRGAFIARGVSARTMLLAMGARKKSPSKGHETSHHSCYPELGVLPGTGMVGSSISIGAGAALALSYKGTNNVVLNFFGDGAANRGDFHEAINLSGAWKLPCIFIIENNQIAVTMPANKATACKKFSDRAIGYGIPGYTIDGNNIIEVYNYTKEAVERARRGEGPTLLDCITFRMKPHAGIIPENRPSEIIEEWAKKCPIKRLGNYLIENDMTSEEDLAKIKNDADSEIEEAFKSIQDEPVCTTDDMLTDVYEEGV